MIPKVGEVYMLDLGYEGKVRPVVIMSREDLQAPRAGYFTRARGLINTVASARCLVRYGQGNCFNSLSPREEIR